MDPMASLKDARSHLLALPELIDIYLDDEYRDGLQALISRFNEFFNIVASVNLRADENRRIEADEATKISDHGFVLLLKLIDLMEKLDLPHRRRELEQISLIFARWTVSFHGRINYLEPVVNAIAQLAKLLQDKQALMTLSNLIADIVYHCPAELKVADTRSDNYRAWQLLHFNRGIIAVRSHDPDIMRLAFDEYLEYLPLEANGFFAEGMKKMDSAEYPNHIQEVLEFYFRQQASQHLH